MRLSGNTILVTGGGSGIGEALARRLHDLGNVVIVAGRRPEALEAAIDGRPDMFAMPLDVGDEIAIEDFAAEVIARHPSLNVLINNAGVVHFEELGRHRDVTGLKETVDTNLLGPMLLTNALIDHLVAQPDAAIINNTSGLAFVPLVMAPTYSATKAALHTYTVCLRTALGPSVEVIELAPPAVRTALSSEQDEHAHGQPLDEFIDEVMELLAREPTPAELLVKGVEAVRYAEAEGRFEDVYLQINSWR